MKESFICSLICRNGIIGGGIYLEDHVVTYKTNKLTVDKKIRNLVLLREEICELTWKWRIFPVAVFTMRNGEQHQFMIFNKRRFSKCYAETDVEIDGSKTV